MLQLANISKSFNDISALENVSLAAAPHQVHGLLGENGAGKSTLMNILFGLLQPDAGTICVDDRPVRIPSPRAAQALGIGMVHQHFKLVPTLTVLENLALSLHTSVRRISARARRQFEELHWNIGLNTRIDRLAVGQQQRVEIAKALLAIRDVSGPAVLILDEPTAVLTPQETAELFIAIERIKSDAAQPTAIIFISHKLAEIQGICDAVTILRRGKLVHTGPASALSAAEITEKMVGGAIESPHLSVGAASRVAAPASAAFILRMDGVTSGMLKNISLQVAPGEILGIAGVDGNGQSDLVQTIVGGQSIASGSVHIGGEIATRKSIRWRSDRLAYIPEDRHLQALVLPFTIQQNLLLKDYRQAPFSSGGWLRFSAWHTHAQNLIRQFDIRCNSSLDSVGRLSGGNQQKTVLARELWSDAKPLVIAVNPTRGLDVGATAFVMKQLLAARARGAAVLLVHSDLDELLAISDRVAVLYNGTLTATSWPKDSKENIGRLMMGVATAA